MSDCDFCGSEIGRTEGKILVLSSGEKVEFCSGKCEKNWKNDRNLEYAD